MATNAAAVLMFVFWYCHKRGKEVRLAREAEEGEEGEDVLEVEVSDDEDAEKVEEELGELEKDIDEKADVLNQPNPTEESSPEQEQSKEKGADVEAEKA